VHQPIPVSPKTPSLMYHLGVPVVIGPLNGGMEYPPAFRREQGLLARLALVLGRAIANLFNLFLPGKRLARLILVANGRTKKALPSGIKGQVVELVENGVDFRIWQKSVTAKSINAPIRFVFVGD
jgi:hypothetical protein